MKRLLVVSDLHCGHLVGLTPPPWQVRPGSDNNLTKREKFAAIQVETWKWYRKQIAAHGPYDAVVCNGDAIDGKGSRSGSSELITADREEQCEMAIACLRPAITKETKVVLMTYGTAYHTGDGEDWESHIARELDAKIGSHEWLDCDGVVFDFKHHCGSSSVPYSRATAVSRDALWSQLWADRGLIPEADVLIRSHVHYHVCVYDLGIKPNWRMTTPPLQAMGTKYGARRCSGLVDYGFLVFDCQKGDVRYTPVVGAFQSQAAKAIKC